MPKRELGQRPIGYQWMKMLSQQIRQNTADKSAKADLKDSLWCIQDLKREERDSGNLPGTLRQLVP